VPASTACASAADRRLRCSSRPAKRRRAVHPPGSPDRIRDSDMPFARRGRAPDAVPSRRYLDHLDRPQGSTAILTARYDLAIDDPPGSWASTGLNAARRELRDLMAYRRGRRARHCQPAKASPRCRQSAGHRQQDLQAARATPPMRAQDWLAGGRQQSPQHESRDRHVIDPADYRDKARDASPSGYQISQRRTGFNLRRVRNTRICTDPAQHRRYVSDRVGSFMHGILHPAGRSCRRERKRHALIVAPEQPRPRMQFLDQGRQLLVKGDQSSTATRSERFRRILCGSNDTRWT
jgi:hypothetical protein